ncbi:hypothetical protein [Kribbella sp. VKM Ac-2566]|uniref:hypothetical protein n=1 Tax=Kribbella sp. VKM Ac-2566 TaxID=2512218 RepID=UPI0010631788|nr:hypothetical protein [Kribbella sp. VKM Ac-2566]TDX08320.1 hypothetical protein EV647_0600 [Kribbella sp. VKM Ac-2566]
MNDVTDLMRRATEYLEPECTDLVNRAVRRGVILRRRRSVLVGFTSAGAVLAAAGVIFAGSQMIGGDRSAGTPVAGMPIVATSSAPSAAAKPMRQVTPNDTQQTLRSLVPVGLKVSQPRTWGDNSIGASYVVDDGKGASLLEVQVMTDLLRERGSSGELHHSTGWDDRLGRASAGPIGAGQAGCCCERSPVALPRWPDHRCQQCQLDSMEKGPHHSRPATAHSPTTHRTRGQQSLGFPPVGSGKDLGR